MKMKSMQTDFVKTKSVCIDFMGFRDCFTKVFCFKIAYISTQVSLPCTGFLYDVVLGHSPRLRSNPG